MGFKEVIMQYRVLIVLVSLILLMYVTWSYSAYTICQNSGSYLVGLSAGDIFGGRCFKIEVTEVCALEEGKYRILPKLENITLNNSLNN